MEAKVEEAEQDEYSHFWTLTLEKSPENNVDNQKESKQMDHWVNELRVFPLDTNNQI